MAINHTTFNLLPRFLAISIALHVCLFTGFGRSLLTTPNPNLGESVLEIRFPDHTPSSALISSSKMVKASSIAKETDVHAITPRESTSSSTPPFSVADTNLRATASITETKEGLQNHLLGVLKTRLSQYLTYPPLARHRGWEGKVLLGLHVEPDGRFERIRIERGSGYAVLDDSALDSLKRLDNLVEARVWLGGRSIDMQLPVIYKLIEN